MGFQMDLNPLNWLFGKANVDALGSIFKIPPAAGTSPTSDLRKNQQAAWDSGAAPAPSSWYTNQNDNNATSRPMQMPAFVEPGMMPTPYALPSVSPPPGSVVQARPAQAAPAPSAPAAAGAPAEPRGSATRGAAPDEALRILADQLADRDRKNQVRLDNAMARIEQMQNPYDTNSETFRRAMADARSRVSSQAGQRQAADLQALAARGALGSTMADAVRFNNDMAARKTRDMAENQLYANAMQNYSNFEQNRIQSLASLLGQDFNNSIQSTGAAANLVRSAFELPIGLDTAAAQRDITQTQAKEAEAKLPVTQEEARLTLSRLGLTDRAAKAQLEAAISDGKLKMVGNKIEIEDKEWWSGIDPTARQILAAGANLVGGFLQGLGQGIGGAVSRGK